MRRFFPSYRIRQLEIIHFAYLQNGHPFNIEDLAEKLSFSVPCVKEDIITLSERYSPLIQVEWDKKNLSIHFQPTITENTFIKLYFKDSNMVRILKTVFFEPLSDPQHLIDQLMLSKTSFYRLIRRFNEETTQDYKFEISITPFNISGDEVMIRTMYTELFTTISMTNQWPFSNIARDDVYKLLDHLARITGHHIHREQRLRASFALAVNLYRTRQLHTISKLHIPTSYSHYIDQLFEDNDFHNDLAYFEQSFHIQFTRKNVQQLIFGILPKGEIKDTHELLKICENNESMKKSIHQLTQYIEWVANTYQVQDVDYQSIVFMLYDFIHQQSLVPGYQPLLHQPYTQFIQRIDSIPPLFFEKSYDFFKRYTRRVRIKHSEENINQIIVQLLMHWTALLDAFEHKALKPNLLILSNINTQHEVLIERTLRAHLGQRFNLIHSPKNFYDHPNLIDSPADIILSNYDIESVPGKVIMIFDYIPNQAIFRKLDEIIDEFHLNKLQSMTLSSETEPW